MISERLKYLLDFGVGDGSCWKNRNTYYYKLEHSTKQRDYFNHKRDILISLGYTGREREREVVLKGKVYHTVSFTLHVAPELNSCHKWLYGNGRKTIDKRLLRSLDARSLAYWYMDDGSANKSRKSSSSPGNGYRYYYTHKEPKLFQIRLYTYAFSLEEHTLMINWFKEKFDLNFGLVNGKRDGLYLKLSKLEERIKFIDLVKPYIIPSMQYKISGLLSYKGIKPIDTCRKRTERRSSSELEEDATVHE